MPLCLLGGLTRARATNASDTAGESAVACLLLVGDLLFSQSQMAAYKHVATGLSQRETTSIGEAIEALLDQVAGEPLRSRSQRGSGFGQFHVNETSTLTASLTSVRQSRLTSVRFQSQMNETPHFGRSDRHNQQVRITLVMPTSA